MITRIITAALFLVWLALVVLGKGGFVHLLLLSAVGTGIVDVMSVLRSRMIIQKADEP
ncbi:MAG TPA: hypothetical protein VL501_07590 [Pyrinomonadaceae bacterium]|nr:hypothetical protein [Pyrinomonadaceae bacterium]